MHITGWIFVFSVDIIVSHSKRDRSWNVPIIFFCSFFLNLFKQNKVPCESFWQENKCVIIFFRRFGWQFCRLAAKELSDTIKPILDQNNVRYEPSHCLSLISFIWDLVFIISFIGIGFESRFVKPFVDGGFFKGGRRLWFEQII